MNNREKQLKKIRQDLYSSDNKKVLESIELLRDEGNSEIIPDIIKIFISNNNEEVQIKLKRFITDIKDQKTVPYLVEAVSQDDIKKQKFELLLSYLWQTRLDFSGYLEKFTDMLIENDYRVGLELLTLIENSMANCKKDEKIKCINKLANLNVDEVDTKKQYILDEYKMVLNNLTCS